MKLANATKLDRKSGGAQWRACPERSRTGTCCFLIHKPMLEVSHNPTLVIPTGAQRSGGGAPLRPNKSE